MPKSYRQLLLDLEVHERLLAARTRISELFFYVEGQLGMGSVVSLLLEHFANTPPDLEWLKERVMQAPRRGRPRVSDPRYTPVPHGTQRKDAHGHEWVSPAANPEIRVCKRCDDSHWPPHRYEFGRPCKNSTGFKWTKEILTANWHFTAEEVAWADG
jgi:hypothetical protein